MPIPVQAVEKLARAPERTTVAYSQLLFLSGSLLFFSAILYIGLVYGYTPYLNSEVEKLDEGIKSFGERIPQAEQEQIAEFYSQLINLKSILQNREVTAPILTWLERNTLQGVYFVKMNLNMANGQLALTGVARNMDEVGGQVGLFESAPDVEKVLLQNAGSNSEGRPQFSLVIFLKQTK